MTEQQKPHPEEHRTATGGPHYGEDVCPDCAGTGEREGATCPTCDGTGKIIEAIYEE